MVTDGLRLAIDLQIFGLLAFHVIIHQARLKGQGDTGNNQSVLMRMVEAQQYLVAEGGCIQGWTCIKRQPAYITEVVFEGALAYNGNPLISRRGARWYTTGRSHTTTIRSDKAIAHILMPSTGDHN